MQCNVQKRRNAPLRNCDKLHKTRHFVAPPLHQGESPHCLDGMLQGAPKFTCREANFPLSPVGGRMAHLARRRRSPLATVCLSVIKQDLGEESYPITNTSGRNDFVFCVITWPLSNLVRQLFFHNAFLREKAERLRDCFSCFCLCCSFADAELLLRDPLLEERPDRSLILPIKTAV